MSFGFSVADFAALGQLAWRIYKACKDAPDSFKNISQEVSSLHLVLKEIEETLSSDSGLSAPQQSRLQSVGDGCRVVLEDLQLHLDKYNSLGTKSKRTWDRLGWGSKDIVELRSRLVSNTVILTSLLNTFQINVRKKLEIFKQECRDGKHEGSMVSTQTVESLSADEKQAWRAIRKDLEDVGISVEAFDANKDFILNWFKTAISTGAFEEQTFEAEISSMSEEDDLFKSSEDPRRDSLLQGHLEDPETGTNLPFTSIQSQALKLSSEAKDQSRISLRIAGPSIWLLPKNTKLHKAVRSESETKIRELLEEGVDINMRDEHGMMPLHHAVCSSNVGIVRLLLSKGPEIPTRDKFQRTALHMAVEKEDYRESMAQLLLDNGAQINNKDKDGSTELHWAARFGDEKVVKLLLNHGAKIEEKDNYGSTALHLAVRQVRVAQLLLNNGAKIKSKDAGGSTELHLAARSGDEKVMKLLLNHGAKIEEKDKMGYTALHWAIRAGRVTMVQLLLESGATSVGKDRCGRTLLQHAVRLDDESEALLKSQLLLKHGANPNEIIEVGFYCEITLLHWAAMEGREELVRTLLYYGAEVDKSDSLGRTAQSVAANHKIASILLHHGAQITTYRDIGYP